MEKSTDSEINTKVWRTLHKGFVAGIFAVIGIVVGAVAQGVNNTNLERKKLESTLILRAIETGDQKKSAANLSFLVKAGFIEDRNGQIAALGSNPENTPVLPVLVPIALPCPKKPAIARPMLESIPEGAPPDVVAQKMAINFTALMGYAAVLEKIEGCN